MNTSITARGAENVHMETLWDYLGISWMGALGVVVAAAVIYAVFTAVVTVWWRHFRAANTAFAFALTVM